MACHAGKYAVFLRQVRLFHMLSLTSWPHIVLVSS